MKVLVIPDVHLKYKMFERASRILKEGKAEKAVCLMDLPDDWNQEMNLDLYFHTFETAREFAEEYPESLWCYGNHDLCYLWDQRESGYSVMASLSVCEGIRKLREALPEESQLAYLHRIDDVLFLHGGLCEYFVSVFVPKEEQEDKDQVIRRINAFSANEMWTDISPIWFRPQFSEAGLYQPEKLLQVVGHTPTDRIRKDGSVISCDTFSTDRRGRPIGTQEFLLIDTETLEYRGVK